MAILYEVSAVFGTYTDKQGNEKKRYVRMGVVLQTRNGGLMLKCESIPVGWDGSAFLNEPREKEQQAPQASGYSDVQMDPNEDVPF